MAQSQVLSLYPHLVPGLCGRLSCPRLCARVCHCSAGQRLAHQLLAARAAKRFAAKTNRQQEQVCQRIRKLGLCSSLCQQCGGCFLPHQFDTQSELKRKAHRPQKVLDLLTQYQEAV